MQRHECEANLDRNSATRHRHNRRDFDLGDDLRLLDGEHDVFGDGSVVCLPSMGTRRDISRCGCAGWRRDCARGDACYFCRSFRECRLPRYVHNRKTMLAGFDLKRLNNAGRIFFGDDPECLADSTASAGAISRRCRA